ncbi:Ca-activated chloride channel family protein [Lysobacter enzymogenes]|uniref:VIT domain-containing protein n=1 Tax=Lysobacter enzymogenes TaxID=69 RepID=UPI00339826D5
MTSRLPATLAGLLLALPTGLAALGQPHVRGDVTAPPPAPPLLLVRGAETPIRLESAQIDAELSGGLAHTAIELVFRNPNRRALEGELQFPLREGQQIDGFALDIDGKLRPAVPVPKDKGRAVFEQIERRGVDPALLERTAGNQFKLRIYPIPAQGTRRVRLELREALRRDGGRWRFELPLAFAADAGRFDLQLRSAEQPQAEGLSGDARIDKAKGGYRLSLTRAPAGGALALSVPAAAKPRTYVQDYAGERYFLAEVPLPGVSAPRPLPAAVGLLWDSSASGRKRDHASELALLDRYFRRAGNVVVSLIRLRDRAEAPRAFRVANGDWSALRRELDSTVYDGASAAGGWAPRADIGEYLLVGDGLFNFGAEGFPKLGAQQRLYALNSAGANADAVRLSALAQGAGGRLVSWQRAGELDRAAAELLEQGPSLTGIDALGADQVIAAAPFAQDGMLRIAGRLRDGRAELSVHLRDGDIVRTERVVVDAESAPSAFPARLWANWSIAALEAEPELNRAAIARLGQRFGVVTGETSLIVLDSLADYVRYDIAPPDGQDEFLRLKAVQAGERDSTRKASLDRVAGLYARRIEWWQRDWPKSALPPPPKPAGAIAGNELARRRAQSERYASDVADAAGVAPVAAMAPPPAPAPVAEAQALALESIVVTGSRMDKSEAESDGGAGARRATIALQPWQPDSPYARRLRAAPAEQVYRLYLDERDSHAASTAFYLDVADVLEEKGQHALALRVLSNLAELDLENRHILRVLGYRLLQANEPALALPVFERVLALAEEEPQSFRDLGLAYAAAGQYQRAVDHLYEVAQRDWDARFPGIEEIALAELNAIAAAHPGQTDLSRVDPRLRRNLPLGLRAVLSWDSDNSDMDLWVTDPNGEKCYYGHKLTYQGGRITDDFTGGYGPEEFSLRTPKPGKYKVEANFFGDRQQLVTGATTLQLWLSTGFGGAGQVDRKVTLRLKNARETVLVGEFEVK